MNLAALNLAASSALLLAAGAAQAESTSSRDLEGLKAYQERRYRDAVEILRDDLSRHPLPTSAFTLGLAFEQLGDWLKAADAHRLALGLAVVGTDEEQHLQLRARQDAAEQLASLEKRIPKLTIRVEGAAAEAVDVTLDDMPLSLVARSAPVAVNPGTHLLKATCRRSSETQSTSVAARAMATTPVTLEIHCREAASEAARHGVTSASRAPAREDARRLGTWDWLGIGVAGAGVGVLGTGTYLLAAALGNKHDAEPHCQGDYCDPQGKALRDSAARQGRQATACAIGGGSLLLLGVSVFVASRAGWLGARAEPAVSFDVDVKHGGVSAMVAHRF